MLRRCLRGYRSVYKRPKTLGNDERSRSETLATSSKIQPGKWQDKWQTGGKIDPEHAAMIATLAVIFALLTLLTVELLR